MGPSVDIQYYYLICTRFHCICAVSFRVVTRLQNFHKCRHMKWVFSIVEFGRLLNTHYLRPYESTSRVRFAARVARVLPWLENL